jgi:hypothetical protein
MRFFWHTVWSNWTHSFANRQAKLANRFDYSQLAQTIQDNEKNPRKSPSIPRGLQQGNGIHSQGSRKTKRLNRNEKKL